MSSEVLLMKTIEVIDLKLLPLLTILEVWIYKLYSGNLINIFGLRRVFNFND